MRGVTAQELHGQRRHIYIAVDTSNSNWKEYLLEKANRLPHGGILHVIEAFTYKELERMYV